MTITIENNKIIIPKYGEFNADGSDLTENKLLEVLNKIKNEETIVVDPKLIDDDKKKCELIKEILDTYIINFFAEDNSSVDNASNDEIK